MTTITDDKTLRDIKYSISTRAYHCLLGCCHATRDDTTVKQIKEAIYSGRFEKSKNVGPKTCKELCIFLGISYLQDKAKDKEDSKVNPIVKLLNDRGYAESQTLGPIRELVRLGYRIVPPNTSKGKS